ncbi:hypothetical protein ACFLXY_00550 [Chloroflexota bacterium]
MNRGSLTALLSVVLVCLMIFPSCNDNEMDEEIPASGIEFRIEKYGTWDYSNALSAVNNDFNYHSDSALIEAATLDTVEIGGTHCLIMTIGPNVTPGENSRLFIFDIENPVSPRLISSIVHPDEERKSYLVNDIVIEDGIAYAGLFGDKGLWVVDISDPTSPVDMGISQVETNSNVLVSGDYLYSSGQRYNGIIVCDISNPDNAKEVTRLDIPTRDCRLEISSNLLFQGIKNILTIYDISDPVNPEKLVDYAIPVSGGLSTEMGWEGRKMDWSDWAHINDIQVYNNYVYVAFGAGGVRVINITNPESPKEIKTASVGRFAIALNLENNLLYVTRSDYENSKLKLEVLDISEPQHLSRVDSITTESDFISGGITYAYCWSRPLISGHYILVPGMRKIDVYRRVAVAETGEDDLGELSDSQDQIPEIPDLKLAQPYRIIGERGLAIEDFDRSVGLWLITSETALGFEERAQTVIKAVIDLYARYKRDHTSVTLIAGEDLEHLDYASAKFSSDGLGPEGMTGSAPANHGYWKVRATDYMYSEIEMEIARLWWENMDRFPQTDLLSSRSYDEEALRQYVADTLGISYEEVSYGEAKVTEYDVETLLGDWTQKASKYHIAIEEPDVIIEPRPGHRLGNAEKQTGVILGNVRVEPGLCDRDYYSSKLDLPLQKGDPCLIVSGNITNLSMDRFEIALWADGYDKAGKPVSYTLDAAHIPGQIGMHLETNETGEFVLHMNPEEHLKVIHIYGAAYLVTPP